MAEPAQPALPNPAPEPDVDPELEREQQRERELEAGRMPFVAHLRELRVRLRNAIIALIAGFVLAIAFSRDIYVFLAEPLRRIWVEAAANNPALATENLAFYPRSLLEAFWTYFSLAFWAGIFLASPFIFHQIWKFIAPGLYKSERNIGVWFAIASAIFFTGGAAFCYFFVLPVVYEFLLNYATANLADMSAAGGKDAISIVPLLSMKEYLDFAKKFILSFGFIFELPLFIFFLATAGIVTHRGLWKFNRYAIVLAFVVGAILTPGGEVYSQTMMSVPIVILYNLSIGVAWVVTRRRERRQAHLA